LKQLDAGSWRDGRFAGERIPTLEEVLALARGRGRLLLDVKAEGLAAPIAAIYRRLAVPWSDALIGSWTPEQVAEFATHMPGAPILRANGAPEAYDAAYFADAHAQGIRGFEIGDYWPPTFVHMARAAGMLVIAYTVNDAGTMRRLVRMGVDGIETDDVRTAVSVLRERPAPMVGAPAG